MLTLAHIVVSFWTLSMVIGAVAIEPKLGPSSSLATQLFTVLSSYPKSDDTDIEAMQDVLQRLTGVYSHTDKVWDAEEISEASVRAAKACDISRALFPKLVITEEPAYTQERKGHW